MKNDKTKLFTFFKATLEVKFENYIALQDFVEEHISKVQKEIDFKCDQIDEIEDIEKRNYELNIYEKELGSSGFKFDHEFPNRIRYSSIIQTYSMLEVNLKWLCNKLKKINNNPIGISDLKGTSDLAKGKLFLRKMYNVDFSKLNPEWSFINDMRKIRNQIIHNNGDFRKKDTEILRIINQTEELGIMWDDIEPEIVEDKDYEIKIKSNQLNKRFVKNVKSLFDKIIIEIENKEKMLHRIE